MKVLFIEDDPASRCYLMDTLVSQGHEVCMAENGQVGLQRYYEFWPDLILCDVEMPVMDGLEFLTVLRRRNETVSVVMMTAFGCEEYAIKALQAGANDYLKKPLRHSELLPLLQRYAEFSLGNRPGDPGRMNERLMAINHLLRRELQKQTDLPALNDQTAPLTAPYPNGIAYENSGLMLRAIDQLVHRQNDSGGAEKLLSRYKAMKSYQGEHDQNGNVRHKA